MNTPRASDKVPWRVCWNCIRIALNSLVHSAPADGQLLKPTTSCDKLLKVFYCSPLIGIACFPQLLKAEHFHRLESGLRYSLNIILVNIAHWILVFIAMNSRFHRASSIVRRVAWVATRLALCSSMKKIFSIEVWHFSIETFSLEFLSTDWQWSDVEIQ